jgi:hypothetical protein
MNSGTFTTFDTLNFWAMPLEKPNMGKPVQESSLLSFTGEIMSLQQQSFTTLIKQC